MSTRPVIKNSVVGNILQVSDEQPLNFANIKRPHMLQPPKPSHLIAFDPACQVGPVYMHKGIKSNALGKNIDIKRPVPPMLQAPRPSRQGNWITNLIGRSYSDALTIIAKQRYPCRLVQVDGVVIDQGINGQHNEIFITVQTKEKFKSTATGGPTESSHRQKDIMRCSNWIASNMGAAFVSDIKLSAF